jgi:hypothetical protein
MNYRPRIGFAYDMFGNQKTILRGGSGMFFERNAGNEEYNMGANIPFSNSSTTNFAYMDNPAVSYTNGVSAGLSPTTPQGFTGVQSNLPITTVYQYSLGIEQQLRSNMVASIGYVGNNSVHMSQTVDLNGMYPSDITDRTQVCGPSCGGAGGVNGNYFRQYRGFSDINIVGDEGTAHYHGLQATFRATAWQGLTLGAAYTYSHAWDVIDAQLFNNLESSINPRYSFGTSGYDRRQIGVVNFDYTLPIFEHSKGMAHNLVGGWTISGVGAMNAGNPLTIGAGSNTLGFAGGESSYADRVGPVKAIHSRQQWFNGVGAFAQPAPLTYGNAGKNSVQGPGRDSWSISVFKDFHFTERTGIQFKADAFNAWNHTQITGVNTGVLTGALGTGANAYNSNEGTTSGAADPRVYQLGAKAYF